MPLNLHESAADVARLGLCTAVVALAPMTALAQVEWTKLSTTAQGHTLHVQTPVRPNVGTVIQLTTLLDYGQTQYWGHKGERYQSSTTSWELNCSTGAYRSMGFSAHAHGMGRGAVITQQSQSTDWAPAPSGSIPSELLRWACR